MDSINPLDELQTAIVDLLIDQPYMKMLELQEALAHQYGLSYTQQNLYRVVGHLTDCGMLLKTKGKMSIDLYWMSHLQQFAEDAIFSISKNAQTSIDLDISEGESREFVADSLKEITPIWDGIDLALATKQGVHDIYQYLSHPYWTVCMHYVPNDLQEFAKNMNITVFKVVGNDTFMDVHSKNMLLERPDRKVVVDTSLSYPKEGYLIECTGDFIVEFAMPEKINSHFEFLFKTTTDLEKFNEDLFFDVYSLKVPCSITVHHDKKRAQEVRENLAACHS